MAGAIKDAVAVFRVRMKKMIKSESFIETYLNFLLNASVNDDDMTFFIAELFELAMAQEGVPKP